MLVGRLALVPGLRRLWRDRQTVQFGTDPRRAVVLEFADPALARVLDLLDGSRTGVEGGPRRGRARHPGAGDVGAA